jgi:hypothetical protein
MTERLVDVALNGKGVLHTYPVTIKTNGASPPDTLFERKALKAAAFSGLVKDDEISALTARMHIGRSGQLSPYGDCQAILAETKAGLHATVREQAYLRWEQAGCPEGRSDDFWHAAQQEHFSKRAYCLWERAGCPEGRADEFWRETVEFEV